MLDSTDGGEIMVLMTNSSPVWISFIRGIGLSVLATGLGYLMVPGNDLAFGSWTSVVVMIASLADGIVEKLSGNQAFGTISK